LGLERHRLLGRLRSLDFTIGVHLPKDSFFSAITIAKRRVWDSTWEKPMRRRTWSLIPFMVCGRQGGQGRLQSLASVLRGSKVWQNSGRLSP